MEKMIKDKNINIRLTEEEFNQIAEFFGDRKLGGCLREYVLNQINIVNLFNNRNKVDK